MEYNEKVAASPYRDLTPHTVKPSQALVTLNGFVTLVTLGGAVPFHPEMMHYLRREGGDGMRGREGGEKRKHGAEKQAIYTKTQVSLKPGSFC